MRIAGPVDPASLPASAEEVVFVTLPGGPAAVVMHTGPYETLQQAYPAMELWMDTQGFKPGGAPWESYVTDPTAVPDPKDWKTEIFWPIVPKST